MSLLNLLFSNSEKLLRISWGDVVKRCFDILVSSLVLIFISPIYGLIALAIRRDSPGPVLYRGARFGKGGKTFDILKFRTMYETPESYRGPRVTAQDDPRVTPLGHWLRNTKLNELPQFWNVLIGEMSLVGPRPEDPSFAETWPNKVREEILSVRPGITSPASIQYRNEESLLAFGNVLEKYLHELTPDKIRLDQLYVRYRSFWLDLDILMWTTLILIPRIQSYSVPENLILIGPITRLIRRYVRWFTIDLAVTFASIGITGLIWRSFGPLDLGLITSILLAIGFALILSLTGAIFGVNRIAWSKANHQDVYDLLPAWLIATTIALIVCSSTQTFPIWLVFVASTIALGGFVIVRYRSRLITGLLSRIIRFQTNTMAARERVIIVGSGRTAEHIAWLLGHPVYSSKFQVVGFVVDDLMTQGMRMYGSKIIGTTRNITQLVKKHDIGIMILADHRMGSQECQTLACACQGILTKVVVIPDIFGSLNGLFDTQPENRELESRGDVDDYRCEHCLVRFSSLNGGASEYQSSAVES
jgi:lipopolysaccharide/colanic/teichoic acid biosynthesis glycosyltransferase